MHKSVYCQSTLIGRRTSQWRKTNDTKINLALRSFCRSETVQGVPLDVSRDSERAPETLRGRSLPFPVATSETDVRSSWITDARSAASASTSSSDLRYFRHSASHSSAPGDGEQLFLFADDVVAATSNINPVSYLPK